MLRTLFPSGRKSLLFLALAIAILIAGVWWSQRPPPEPMANGQSLSAFLIEFPTKKNRFYLGASDATAVARLRAISYSTVDSEPLPPADQLRAFGPAAVPWLAYMAGHGPHPTASAKPRPFDHAPPWLRRWVPITWGGLRKSSPVVQRSAAIAALTSLGPDAAAAAPSLARCLDEGPEDLRLVTAEALYLIGPAAWPVEERLLAHGQAATRLALVRVIFTRRNMPFDPSPSPGIDHTASILTKACLDPDSTVRAEAVDTIASCHTRQPDLPNFDAAIPDLIRLLSDPSENVRAPAAKALVSFGVKAAAAAPRLIELLDDPDPYVRYYAILTMPNVDAEKRSALRLLAMLHDPDNTCRKAAAGVLQLFDLYPTE